MWPWPYCRLVAAVLELGLDLRVERAGRGQGRGGQVVDHLGVDVLRAAEDGQAGTFGRPEEPLADAALAPEPAGLDQQVMVGGVHGTILERLGKDGDLRPATAVHGRVPVGRCGGMLLRAERLAGLAADDLALVADALALVGLGGADLADLGGELADRLLVGAA